MNVEEIRASVLAWFANRRASLELSSGWFGRSFDNQHRLTRVEAHGENLTIELDGEQELVLHTPAAATVERDRLRIGPFGSGTWQWYEYGSRRFHSDVLPPGSVTFWAARSRDIRER